LLAFFSLQSEVMVLFLLSLLVLANPFYTNASPLNSGAVIGPNYLYLNVKAVDSFIAPTHQKRQAALGLRNYLNGTAYSVKREFSSYF
jgi:hypothetical protein